ncbi:MAG: beta-lactamase family protein [Acidobacteriaceae bacterium]|nr:beta-lactamase family protein [Acidobacteriaceae bacterium]
MLRAQSTGNNPAQTTVSEATLAEIHKLTGNFLVDAGVSAAQLAVTRNGVLIFSEAYATKPPRGFSPVNKQTLFRLASCSKLFACAAIDALHRREKLDLDAKVFPLLKIQAPASRRDKPDPHINDITVRHLVEHAGGWNDHESVRAADGAHIPGTEWDPVFSLRQIAIGLGLSSPPSKLDIARYMYGKPLQFIPGTQNFNTTYQKSYSNFGYLLLGLIVESVSGQSFIDFVRTGLGAESDTSNVYVSRLLEKARDPREVWYIDPGSGPTVFDPRSSEKLMSAYGGGGFLPEMMDSAGGLMTNAETLALFISRHAAWGLGGRNPRSARTGGMPGTASLACSRRNGIDCAYVLNTRNFNGGPSQQDKYISSLESLLDQL